MMMYRWTSRIFFGLLFAVPFALLTVAWAQADYPRQVEPESELECQNCHPAFHASWLNSAHGRAVTDPDFQQAWQAQGNPRDCLSCHTTGYDPRANTYDANGITCQACHGPIPENHPAEPMPADRSANLCGTCHTETLFEWQVSKHRQTNLSCVDCHGQHSTDLKAEDSAALCASCHRERSSNFAHTAHSAEGLTCSDCHLAPLDGDLGEGHAMLDHSFHVKLSTCNACHAYQMHDPVAVHPDRPPETEPLDAMASVESLGVNLEPDPVSPIWYAILSALVGMAFGMLVAPWIERWYRRLSLNVEEIKKE